MELSENIEIIETKYGKISRSPDEFAWDSAIAQQRLKSVFYLLVTKPLCGA
ncbi:clamp-loader subunit [Klebsiella phage CPRSA]|nr:clamp-loader subunit [Klebsiella phage CPRSA]